MSRLSLFHSTSSSNVGSSGPGPSSTSGSSSRFSLPSVHLPGTSSNAAPTGFSPGNGKILDRPINRTRGVEVSMGAWAFLYSEIVSYSQTRVDSISDLEARLSALGRQAGIRIVALLLFRNAQAAGMKDPKQEHRLIPILQFVHTQVYRYLFGRPADGLEKSVEGEDEYMLSLNQPPLTQHISVPKDMGQLSVEAFTAGVVEGVLDGLNVPARVTAHGVPTKEHPNRTVILIKLDQAVMEREEGMGK